jgi:hypothetical protein
MPYRQPDDVGVTIAKARALLLPSPVRLHHAPRWFASAVRKLMPSDLWGRTSSWSAIDNLRNSNELHWLDHWGSTTLADGRIAFISEPYDITPEAIAWLAEIAMRAGCEFWVSPNSWWYPGATIRLIFAEKVQA